MKSEEDTVESEDDTVGSEEDVLGGNDTLFPASNFQLLISSNVLQAPGRGVKARKLEVGN